MSISLCIFTHFNYGIGIYQYAVSDCSELFGYVAPFLCFTIRWEGIRTTSSVLISFLFSRLSSLWLIFSLSLNPTSYTFYPSLLHSHYNPNTYNSQDSLVDIHLTIVAAELDSLNCLTPMHFLFSLHYQRLRRTNKSYRGHDCCGKPCWFSARIRKMQ